MKRILSLAFILLALAPRVYGQTGPDAGELTRLLKEFLAGASRNDAKIHDRFWADDLIYTGAAGRRIGKADIMRGLRSGPDPAAGEQATIDTAEDIRIQQYNDTAIVAFRLVASARRDGATEVTNYFNTGTFLKRDGKWQAVGWQATRIPRPEEQSKREVGVVEAAFHHAIIAGDAKDRKSVV